MMPFIQSGKSQSIPALALLLNAVDVHHELVCCLLQCQPLARAQNRLRSHSGTGILVQNTHRTQRLLLNRDQQ